MKKWDMEKDEWAYYQSEALAPEAVAICGARRVTWKALWQVQMAIYKTLHGIIRPEIMAEKVIRAVRRSERDIARGAVFTEIVQA
ncbi:hypothetical protein [Pseudothauera hydrothermalis]|uniref:hypothetical protein n=1 Tax=Pseudothauera hydrothermalis TaxID=2184083 RepID=UPI000E09B432|nr:hypothetical protein [Pseudothauera hydrothermalis]